jgi:hypothetical protein
MATIASSTPSRTGDGLRTLKDRTFLLLTVAISLAFAWILWPFYGAVLWATILTIVFAPNALQDEEFGQNVDHIDRLETMRDIILIGGWTANRASAGIWTGNLVGSISNWNASVRVLFFA